MKAEETPNAKKRDRKKWVAVGAVIALLIGLNVGTRILNPGPEEIPLTEVIQLIEDGEVKEAKLLDANRVIEITLENDEVKSGAYTALYGGTLMDLLREKGVEANSTPASSPNVFVTLFFSLIPFFLIVGLAIFFLRGRGGLGIGKLSSKRSNPVEVPKTRFDDVAGIGEIVDELREVTDFLKKPERFVENGARIPRGFLLSGPPGTGKTLLARAVAGEAGVPFFALSGSDFVQIYAGAGAARVRELFENARKAKSAIIFIDEIDAVGRARGNGSRDGANDEREGTLNALLTEMDGFEDSSGVIVLAASNRPDILDAALTRPGRFDRKIVVHAPDRSGREQIFKLHTKDMKLASDVNFESLSRRTPGLTGADISGLVNEAALESVRKNDVVVSQKHFESALQTSVLGRERRNAIISQRDQEITAWHESGHTIAALTLEDAHDPVTVTIIPRGPAGGVTWMGGSDNDFMSIRQAKAQLVVAMGGRAAEEMLLGGEFTQGASGDLKSATELATEMIRSYGMGERLISFNEGNLGQGDLEKINAEVAKLIQEALETARTLLREHEELMSRVAKTLIEKETLHFEELKAIQAELPSVVLDK